MNKYLIIASDSIKSIELKKNLLSLLDDQWKSDEIDPKYIFVIGGDGTFLNNIDRINKFKNSFVICINGGNFGFYAYFDKKNIHSILKNIKKDDKYFKPMLINVNISHKKYLGINEVIITSNKTLNLKIEINKIIYQKFRGTGIMVSTPTGSTGRSRSAGGAIISPDIDVLQFIEIEPINQKGYNTLLSPIILPKDTKMKIIITNEKNESFFIVDGTVINNSANKEIQISFEKSNFFLFKPYDLKSYIKKLRKAFISGG